MLTFRPALFLVVEDYIRYRQGGPVEAQVFQAWFVAVFPEKLADDFDTQSKLELFNLAFPGISALSLPEQIRMGCEVLNVACKDVELMAHPKTEPSN